MAVSYKLPRGTSASLTAKASAGTIIVGQLYLLTDLETVAVGTSASTYATLQQSGSGGVPSWNTAARPTAGSVRVGFNTDLKLVEFWTGVSWVQLQPSVPVDLAMTFAFGESFGQPFNQGTMR